MQRQLEMKLLGRNYNIGQGLPLFDRKCGSIGGPITNQDYILSTKSEQFSSQLSLPFRGTYHSGGEEPTLWYH